MPLFVLLNWSFSRLTNSSSLKTILSAIFYPMKCPCPSLTPGSSLLGASNCCVAVRCCRHCCLCHHRPHSLLAKLILDQQWRGNKLKPFPLRRCNTDWRSVGGAEEGGGGGVGLFLLRSPVLQPECTLSLWSEQQLTRSQIKLQMHLKKKIHKIYKRKMQIYGTEV